MRIISDKKELMKLCSFIVMGDGGVYYSSKGGGNCGFIMNMKKSNIDYVELCSDILSNVTSTKISDRTMSNNDGCNRQPQVTLTTPKHPFFTKLRERIYIDKYKGIDPHALKLLDFEALSFLYMSDGCFNINFTNGSSIEKPAYNLTLNMKRLSYGDQMLLKNALKNKLDLEFNIQRSKEFYYLRLRTKDIRKFMDGIRPYITPSFSYKILDEMPLKNKIEGGDIV